MIDIKQILCPIDFSTHSRQALDHAIAMARRFDARITALHVIPPDPADLSIYDPDRRRDELSRFVTADTGALPGVAIDVALTTGSPVREIVEAAVTLKADLLVLGSHGRSGVKRLVLGSVAERTLRESPCPVLIVPPHHPEAVPADPVVFRNILCPIDFSPSSMRALEYAATLAQETDGRLTIVHVAGPEFEPLATRPAGLADGGDEPQTIAGYFSWREDEIRRRMADALPATVATYCTVEHVLRRGKPGPEILDAARDHGSDLIVIGVTGRGAADVAVFGSVAQHVIRYGSLPVLTVREAR